VDAISNPGRTAPFAPYCRLLLAAIGMAMMPVSALAAPPALDALEAPNPVPSGLVLIHGTNLAAARIVWNASSPTPRILRGAIQGAVMFSIPSDVAPGSYAVALENSEGRSLQLTVDIDGTLSNAKPRIDHITLLETAFEPGGMVRTMLYVQGANIDVDATVVIDGTERASQAHKALFNDVFGANPAMLGYPIRHYLSRVVPLDSQPVGSVIDVQIRNPSGETSEWRRLTLPLDAQSLDSDGDGIPDVVEINGYRASAPGSPLVDLKALGADPFRKDIFIELDIMQGALYRPLAPQGGRPGTFDVVRQMFANAPILNPFGPNGINLFLDASGTVPSFDYLDFRPAHDAAGHTASFEVLKRDHFTPARRGLFHYAIWARSHPNGWSGESNIDFGGTKVGSEFMVTLGDASIQYQTLKSQAATFAHELGHNLGQKHGGVNHSRYTPNYWSVMSYAWQLRTSSVNSFRQRYPTCTPIYYATPGAIEVDGALPSVPGFVIDYSEGMGPDLVPSNGSLNEKMGVCGLAIDWNKNGVIDNQPVSAPIDEDEPAATRVTDYPNWSSLRFEGPRLGGRTSP
jgi:hypothetical protein